MNDLYDVAIIGLGPAGATLARLLSPDLRVVAIDKKCPTGEDARAFTKPCGGLLAPDAQKALSRFGQSLPKSVLVDPQIFAVRTLDTGTGLDRHYQRFYMNMDRAAFDRLLISQIPVRVERVMPASVVDISREGSHFRVRIKRDGRLTDIETRCVVGADGANSILRRRLFPDANIRRYVALQEWYEDRNPHALYSCFFDAQITDCYAWSVSKDGHLILGGAFPIDGCKARFERLKEKLVARGYVLGEPIRRESCEVLRPRGLFDFETGGNGAFLVGEAAGFISSSSLEGISYALESGRALAEILGQRGPNPNRAYDRRMLGMRIKLLLKNIKSQVLYTPWLRYLVMKSGVDSIELARGALHEAESGAKPDSVQESLFQKSL